MDKIDELTEKMSGAAGSAELQTTLQTIQQSLVDKQNLLKKLNDGLQDARANIASVKSRYEDNNTAIGKCTERVKSNVNYKAARWKKCGAASGYSDIPVNSPAKDYPNNHTDNDYNAWKSHIADDKASLDTYNGIIANNPPQISGLQDKQIPSLQAKILEVSQALQVSSMTPEQKTSYEAAQKVAEGQAAAAQKVAEGQAAAAQTVANGQAAAAQAQAQTEAMKATAGSKHQKILYVGIGLALILGVTMVFVFKGKKAPVA